MPISGYLVSGDNISLLTNDANYIVSGAPLSNLTNDVNYVISNTGQANGGTAVTNVVSITQSAYDAMDPADRVSGTLYIVPAAQTGCVPCSESVSGAYYAFNMMPEGYAQEDGEYVGLAMSSVPTGFLTSTQDWWLAFRIGSIGNRDEQAWTIVDGGAQRGVSWRPNGQYFGLNQSFSFLYSTATETPASSNQWIIYQWDDSSGRVDAWVGGVRELNQTVISTPPSTDTTSASWFRTVYNSNYNYNWQGSISNIIMGTGAVLTNSEAQSITADIITFTGLPASVQSKATNAWSFSKQGIVIDTGSISLTPETGGGQAGFEYVKAIYEAPLAIFNDATVSVETGTFTTAQLSSSVTNPGSLSLTYSKLSGVSWASAPDSTGGITINSTGIALGSYSGFYRITDGDANTSDMTLTITTTASPTFFSEDWESGTNGWTIVDDPATVNQWEVGTAAYNSGTQGAYISFNGGTNNQYDNTDEGQCHIYKAFTSPSDVSAGVTLRWDWKAVGESGWDNMKVYIAASGTTPVAGSDVSSMYRIGMYYAGAGSYMTTTASVGSYVSSANTEYVLIFSWKNDNSGGSNPPAAIDNIFIYTN